MIQLATVNRCMMPADFKTITMENMIQPGQDTSTMYLDFAARRPMEIETYLGAPCQLARQAGIAVPHIETLYTILRHINTTNKDRPATNSQSEPPAPMPQQARMPPGSAPPNRPMNGSGRPMQMRSGSNGMPPPPPSSGGRRGPPPVNGHRGLPPNGYPPRGPSSLARQPSFTDDNLVDDFRHVVLYDEIHDGDAVAAYGDNTNPGAASLRARELALREKELRLREQEMAMRSRDVVPRRPSHNKHQGGYMDDDDDEDDFFDPADLRHAGPPIDPDNFDMMSVTSRRTNKRTPSQGQLRQNMFQGGPPMRPGSYSKAGGRHRTSAQLMADMPVMGANILDNPMMGFASNRYGNVDRKEMADESRANSLTASRLHEMGGPHGPYPPPSRRTSRSPGNPLGPMSGGPTGRPQGRPSPPHEAYPPVRNGRPSPPGQMPAPAPRYPPGQGNMVQPRAIEQQVGVSKTFPPKPTKSLTGSASASAGSGDGSSANTESDPSAHSSTSSFAPRVMMGVR